MTVHFSDEAAGLTQTAVLNALVIDEVTPGSPVSLTLDGLYQNIAIGLSGTVGDLAVVASGGALPLDLVLSADKARITLKGVIEDPLHASGADVTVTAALPDIRGLAEKVLPMALPDLGAIDLSAHLVQTERGIRSDLKLTFGDNQLDFTGEVVPRPMPDINGTIKAAIADPANLAEKFAVMLPPLDAFALKAAVKAEQGRYHVNDLALSLGQTDISGAAAADLGGAVPKLTADLKFETDRYHPLLAGYRYRFCADTIDTTNTDTGRSENAKTSRSRARDCGYAAATGSVEIGECADIARGRSDHDGPGYLDQGEI